LEEISVPSSGSQKKAVPSHLLPLYARKRIQEETENVK
jgi:hypothetical protein